jgi:hypothetical protein
MVMLVAIEICRFVIATRSSVLWVQFLVGRELSAGGGRRLLFTSSTIQGI